MSTEQMMDRIVAEVSEVARGARATLRRDFENRFVVVTVVRFGAVRLAVAVDDVSEPMPNVPLENPGHTTCGGRGGERVGVTVWGRGGHLEHQVIEAADVLVCGLGVGLDFVLAAGRRELSCVSTMSADSATVLLDMHRRCVLGFCPPEGGAAIVEESGRGRMRSLWSVF